MQHITKRVYPNSKGIFPIVGLSEKLEVLETQGKFIYYVSHEEILSFPVTCLLGNLFSNFE